MTRENGRTLRSGGCRKFSTTMPPGINATLKSLAGVAGSPSSAMPPTAVPTAPTPTQTPYAVPTGGDFMAMPGNQRLMVIESAVRKARHKRVNPSVYFNPIAQPTEQTRNNKSDLSRVSSSHGFWARPGLMLEGRDRPHLRSSAISQGR